MEKFSEMKYVRPDGEAYIRTIQKETKNFNEAADFEGAHQAFVAILNANSHFNTTRVMASIRNSQDTNDEFYRKEMEYIFEIEPQIDVEMKKFYEGIYPNFDAGLFEKIREAFPSIDTKQTIRRLSKGMQKQVAFWIAISARPQILILDEPVDGLDPVMRRQIWSLILQDVCDHVGIMNHGKIIIERSLSELQSSICKIQAAFQAEMPKLPKDLEVLHMSTTGRVHTMIVRGEPKQIKEQFTALNPMLMDVLPLSLEEIFIYELGGADYAVRDILF